MHRLRCILATINIVNYNISITKLLRCGLGVITGKYKMFWKSSSLGQTPVSPIQFHINDLAEGVVVLLTEFVEWYQAGRCCQHFGGIQHCQNHLEISGKIEGEE